MSSGARGGMRVWRRGVGATPEESDAARAAVSEARRGARTLARAQGWLWPHWLERRLDPSSPAAAVTGPLGVLVNDAGRRWTAVGVLDGPGEAVVDPCGLVTPAGACWSLDWWIGGDDRWHLPSREPAVRQHREGPGVVETAMRVPAGDAVQRVYAARLAAADGRAAVLVVEVENRSAVPFALALALRPVTVDGIGRVDSVAVDDGGLLVDGRRAVLLARRPRHAAASTLAGGDATGVVLAGVAGEGFAPVEDPAGMAHAIVVLPVAHRASVRAVLPLAWPAQGEVLETFPGGLPSPTNVATAWTTQLRRGARCELADPRLQRLRGTSIARVVLAATADGALDDLLAGPGAFGLASVVEVLATDGFAAEAARLLVAWFEQQQPDGSLPPGGQDATAVALWALGRHWALHRDRALQAATAVGVLDAARRLLASPGAGGPWRRPALEATAELLAAAGEHTSAATVTAALGEEPPATGRVTVTRREAPALVRAAALLLPTRDGDETRVQGGLQLVWDTAGEPGSGIAGAPVPEPGGGGDPALGLAAVALGAAAGDRAAVARLQRLADLASPAGSWPARIHPRTGEGCSGSGDDPAVAAAAMLALRALLVVEHDAGLDLCPVFDPAWYGAGVEAHGLATRHGVMSFAVRWHGSRPALLWELQPLEGAGGQPVQLRIPGLDPAWSTSERQGEALLAEPPQRAGAAPASLS